MFSPADKSTACGMWSTTYFVALAIVVFLIVLSLILSRKMTWKGVKNTLIVVSVLSISSEIAKMIFVGVTYGVEKVEFVPLYFCSLFMYATVLSLFKNKTLQNTGLSFLFFGGIIGATAFFIYPSSCIPNYPIYHFMCIRTMLYHGAMIYVGLLTVTTKYYQPNVRHFWNYLVALLIVGIGAYILNLIRDSNLMYISKPLNIEIVKTIFNAIPHLYPFLAIIVQILVPFWTTYGIYSLAKTIARKKKKGV